MGHANYSNLCDLWVNLLYARGRLSISEAVEVAGKRGEELHASEGGYDADSGMVGMALEEYCNFLSSTRKEVGDWTGPYIEPLLDVYALRPKKAQLSENAKTLLKQCNEESPDSCGVAADALEEEGFQEWSQWVRDLFEIRAAFFRWEQGAYFTRDDDWLLLDRIPWRFCKGKRPGYRDIPRIGNVTH